MWSVWKMNHLDLSDQSIASPKKRAVEPEKDGQRKPEWHQEKPRNGQEQAPVSIPTCRLVSSGPARYWQRQRLNEDACKGRQPDPGLPVKWLCKWDGLSVGMAPWRTDPWLRGKRRSLASRSILPVRQGTGCRLTSTRQTVPG